MMQARVTTLVTPPQRDAFLALAASLGISVSELPVPEPPQLNDEEAARRGFEDLYNLY